MTKLRKERKKDVYIMRQKRTIRECNEHFIINFVSVKC